jgi:hypothetical protein
MKKEILRVQSYNTNDNISLYTIASPESDLFVCATINQCFGIHLSLSDDLVVKIKSIQVPFRRYQYEMEDTGEKILLVVNNSNNHVLLPEFKKIDYLLIVISGDSIPNYSHQLNNLRTTHGINAVIYVNPSEVKSFKKLVI